MTERPEGTPEEAAEPEIEPETAAIEPEPEPEAAEPEPEAAEPEPAEPEPEPEPAERAAEAAAAVAAVATGRAKRREVAPAAPLRAPTPSEVATRVTDPASRIFVIGSVVVFVAILVFGLVGGHGGLLTTTPSPTVRPVATLKPSPSASTRASVAPASVAPSPSPAPSIAASPSPS